MAEEDNEVEEDEHVISEIVSEAVPLRVGEREQKAPVYLKDYDTRFICSTSTC